MQIVDFSTVHDIKAARKHCIGGVPDLVNAASLENVNDFNKVVRMAVGGDVTDVFFDQHAFFVDKVCAFFVNSHRGVPPSLKMQIDYSIKI